MPLTFVWAGISFASSVLCPDVIPKMHAPIPHDNKQKNDQSKRKEKKKTTKKQEKERNCNRGKEIEERK